MMHCSTARLRSVAAGIVVLMLAAMAWAEDASSDQGTDPSFPAEHLEFFEREVRPLLVNHCFECHSANAETIEGGLRLDSRSAVLQGGDTGPAASAGEPAESLLIDAIQYGDLYQMPPKSKLDDAQIAVLTRWVELGLPWPAETADQTLTKAEFDLANRKAEHWAWQPLRDLPPPPVAKTDWPRDDLDRHILAALEAKQLAPAPEADRRTWIRRVYFDLIGLPPTPPEVDAFIADQDPRAYEKVVDHLLNSPHFGERWARHWLDLVRYAESRGHEFDYNVPNAYHYRDYVIRAFNADVPYNQFVVEHIAGDLLNEPRRHPTEGFNESVLGTGFWFFGEWLHSPVDIRKDECDRFDNMLDVFSKTFLGLTVACARCHDHKFDAISQQDYYALGGYLQSSDYRQYLFETREHNGRVAAELQALREEYAQQAAASVSESASSMFAGTEQTLAAASSALRAWSEGSSTETVAQVVSDAKLPEALLEQIRVAADEAKLSENVIARSASRLLNASKDPRDPLWLLGQITLSSGKNQTPAQLINEWRIALTESAQESLASWSGITTIVDYNRLSANQWFSDGYTFGLEPVQIGTWTCDGDQWQVATHGAAQRDPMWSLPLVADDVEGEAAKLGSWNRIGRILRTPTFQLDSRPLHYLVRGSVVAYAAVDSHAMINGPLHGSIVQEFKTDQPNALRWVTHDLRRYDGHNLHLEFSPLDDSPCEILMVVQGEKPPAIPDPAAAAAIVECLASEQLTGIEELCRWYEQTFVRHLTSSGSVANDAGAGDRAALTNWLLEFWRDQQGTIENHPLKQLGAELQERQAAIAKTIRTHGQAAPAMWDGSGTDELLLIRGNVKTPADPVPRRFLEALGGTEQTTVTSGSGRLELAQRVIAADNPFTGRVYVNRIWHHLMGRGIVASTDNFGVLGELPTHPELLDHLALSFMRDGWSTKQLVRRIVLSSTYRMSSEHADTKAAEIDPQNKFWHKMPVRRLQAEAIRDSLLAVSGRLDPAMYGRSVPIHLTPFMQGRGRPTVNGPLDGNGRRSIYIAVRRNFLSPMMLAFDAPQPFSTVGRRSRSNVPAQALILMNDPLVVELCQRWAQRLLAEHGNDTDAAIGWLYESAFSRPPLESELVAARQFLVSQGLEYGLTAEQSVSDARVWTDLCHVMVNVKEFIFIR